MERLKKILETVKKFFKKRKSLGYGLQLITHWIAIIGFLASTIIAIYAIRLTIRLDSTDRTIEVLKELAIKSDSLIFKVYQSQVQNEIIIKELVEQNRIQKSQFEILTKQISLEKNKSIIENQKILIDYYKLVSKFKYYMYDKLVFNKDTFLNLPGSSRMKIINSLSNIAEEIMTNPVVYTNPNATRQWNSFFNFEIKIFSSPMEQYNLNDSINKTYEDKVITTGEEFLNKAFDRFISEYRKIEVTIDDYAIDWQIKFIE